MSKNTVTLSPKQPLNELCWVMTTVPLMRGKTLICDCTYSLGQIVGYPTLFAFRRGLYDARLRKHFIRRPG